MLLILDLKKCTTSIQVLKNFGEFFEFGGKGGNINVKAINAMEGWGINWDALNDSMHYLDKGGIWGNSKIFTFPLHLKVINCSAFQQNE